MDKESKVDTKQAWSIKNYRYVSNVSGLRDDLPSGRVTRRTLDPPDLGTMVAAATDGFMDF